MSTINEQIVTGRAHRVLIDKVAKLWQRISFWTKASDVEFNDGNTAETKVGAIKGITTDLNTTETGYAADMTALAQLNSEIDKNSKSIKIETITSNSVTITPNRSAVFNISLTIPEGYEYGGVLSIIHPYGDLLLAAYGAPTVNNVIEVMCRNMSGSTLTTVVTARILFLKK